MTTLLTIAYRCHVAGSTLFALMGLVYLLRRKFMPYHAVALGRRWEDLDGPSRTLFLASMRIIGSAWLAIALALLVLLRYGFRAGLQWSIYGVPLIGLTVALPALLTVIHVKARTRASPPWPPLAMAVALFLTGLLLSVGDSCAGVRPGTADPAAGRRSGGTIN